MDTPQYEHDCPSCVFLGRYTYKQGEYDLYWCSQGLWESPTIVARISSDPPDYASGLDFGRIHNDLPSGGELIWGTKDYLSPLGEAYRRARDQGYDVTSG